MDAAEIKDGSSETTLHPFSFLPAVTFATQSSFLCHLEKLMEFTLCPLFPNTVVNNVATWTSVGV